MKNTYHNTDEAIKDRVQLVALLNALNASSSALRRDACELWTLRGSRGYVSTWGDGATWQLIAVPQSEISKQAWTWVKKRLDFAELTQDGDAEGCFRLHQLPTTEQAEIIRNILGIRKRIEFSPDEIKRRREVVEKWNSSRPDVLERP